jgi:hypothetical protein
MVFVLFGFKRLYLKSRVPDCQSGDSGAIPGSRKHVARQLAHAGLQNQHRSGQHRGDMPFLMALWRNYNTH